MATTFIPPETSTDLWRELAQQLRVDSIQATAAAGSGHPTSALSAADLLDAVAGSGLLRDVVKLAVRDLPGSGTPAELLHGAGIDAAAIIDAARSMVGHARSAD
jgi:transketolase